MARKGITYNEVVAVIDKIIGSGDEPTIQKIRGILGTGSPNTIHRHLSQWRNSRPAEQRRAVELPHELADALLKEIERQSADARAEVEERLIEAQDEANELAKAGEEIEEELDSIKTAFEAKNEECVKIHNDFIRISDLLSKSERELAEERKLVNEMREEVAFSKNRIATLSEQRDKLQIEIENIKSEVKKSLSEKIEAEKSLAVSNANLASEKSVNDELRERMNDYKNQISLLNEEIKNIKNEHKMELNSIRSDSKEEKEKYNYLLSEANNKISDYINKIFELEKEIDVRNKKYSDI